MNRLPVSARVVNLGLSRRGRAARSGQTSISRLEALHSSAGAYLSPPNDNTATCSVQKAGPLLQILLQQSSLGRLNTIVLTSSRQQITSSFMGRRLLSSSEPSPTHFFHLPPNIEHFISFLSFVCIKR